MKNTIRIDTSHIIPAEESIKSIAETMELYKRLSANISVGLSEMMKTFSIYSQLNYSGIVESFRTTMESYTKLNLSYLSSGLLADSVYNSFQELSKSFRIFQKLDVSESLKAIEESMKVLSKSLAMEQINQLQQIDFSSIFADIIPRVTSLSDIVDTAYTRVQDELEEECDVNDIFTEEEIQEALQEHVENPIKFQERVANWTEKKINQFFIVYMLLNFLYSNFVQPYFQDNIGKPVMSCVISNVKELPQKGAEVIGQIQENIEAIITENTSYYYKVIFIDENGETKEGYVAKRNLKLIEDESDDLADIIMENEENHSQNE